MIHFAVGDRINNLPIEGWTLPLRNCQFYRCPSFTAVFGLWLSRWIRFRLPDSL